MTLLLTMFSLPEIFLFVCLFDEKMKNLILEGSGGVAQSMELQCYHFYSDLAQVHQGN